LRWDWDEDGVNALKVSEDIVEFLVQNTLQVGLQKDSVDILKLASCLGTREFNSSILSAMMGLSQEEVKDLSTSADA